MRRHGFTLVELLLVIATIAVLAGLLIPMIGYARNSAKNAKCESQLANIKATLSLYKDANGQFPERYVPPGETRDVYEDTFKVSGNYVMADVVGSSGWKTIAEALLAQLQTVDRDNYRDLKSLRDPFLTGGGEPNVIRYRPAKWYPLESGAALIIDSDNPPNPDSYQLWSSGLNGRDEFGQRGSDGRKSDDLTNWKQP
jgi:prepilin-type N-terminal cleavage/methylation domain-containing protein